MYFSCPSTVTTGTLKPLLSTATRGYGPSATSPGIRASEGLAKRLSPPPAMTTSTPVSSLSRLISSFTPCKWLLRIMTLAPFLRRASISDWTFPETLRSTTTGAGLEMKLRFLVVAPTIPTLIVAPPTETSVRALLEILPALKRASREGLLVGLCLEKSRFALRKTGLLAEVMN